MSFSTRVPFLDHTGYVNRAAFCKRAHSIVPSPIWYPILIFAENFEAPFFNFSFLVNQCHFLPNQVIVFETNPQQELLSPFFGEGGVAAHFFCTKDFFVVFPVDPTPFPPKPLGPCKAPLPLPLFLERSWGRTHAPGPPPFLPPTPESVLGPLWLGPGLGLEGCN